ncbi:hypothetical protein MMC25_008351 [Agyrium rufum]|nr:hypothetical protein [Agyrium rufum]
MLSSKLGSKVSYPASDAYRNSTGSYWSQQEDALAPSCVVTPTDSQDVSDAVYVLKSSGTRFAIRSGGHTAFAGSANINAGVTLDLRSLAQISVSSDGTRATIGPGATWGQVYQVLEPMNLTVVGGRVLTVGVGGLLLGGGISFFSSRKGFGCDNVLSFEIVLASGTVVNASQNENADLWRALRGGSNNFGIVTSFVLASFSQSLLWGGHVYNPVSTAPQQLSAFTNFNTASKEDQYTSLIQTFAYTQGSVVVVNAIHNAIPTPNPPALAPFTAIEPQLFNTTRISSQTDFVAEETTADINLRRSLMTTTFQNDLDVLTSAFSSWNRSTSELAPVADIVYSLTYEPIGMDLLVQSAIRGGNSLGLNPRSGPLVLVQLYFGWSNSTDDALVSRVGEKLIGDIDNAALAKGKSSTYKYLNYADKSQDPIAGYGKASKYNLQAVSKKYDPDRVFQNQVPGGFKLFM